MQIRPMSPADLPGVLAVQRACYGPGHLEPLEAFASKLTASPTTCWVAEAASGEVLAYLVCLPTDARSLPALHTTQWQAPAHTDRLYLHDLAVSPSAQGLGLGPQLVARARQVAQAQGWQQLVLIAVQGSEPFWARQGFGVSFPPNAAIEAKLSSFGDTARFMRAGL